MALGTSDDVRRRNSLMYTEIEVTKPAEEERKEKILLTHRKKKKKKRGVCVVCNTV